jgi:hypothetical protein
MECGDAFMIDDEDGAKEHLHIVLTNPTPEGEVVTACICTRHRRSETVVCLDVGDHPFIKHPSVVAYHFAAIRKCSEIEKAIETGRARTQQRASDTLLRRIRSGLLESDFVPNGVREFFKSCHC